MSYFMTITGEAPDIEHIHDIRLLLSEQTQVIPIVSRILPSDLLTKTYLFVDETGNTSDNLVNETVDSLIKEKPIEQTRLFQALDACFKVSCQIIIWWWTDNFDPTNLTIFKEKDLFKKHIIDCFDHNKDINAIYKPSPAPKRSE